MERTQSMTIQAPLFWWGAVSSIIESQRGSGEFRCKASLRRFSIQFSVTGDAAVVERIEGHLQDHYRLWSMEG
jgi:hypothetical protein